MKLVAGVGLKASTFFITVASHSTALNCAHFYLVLQQLVFTFHLNNTPCRNSKSTSTWLPKICAFSFHLNLMEKEIQFCHIQTSEYKFSECLGWVGGILIIFQFGLI